MNKPVKFIKKRSLKNSLLFWFLALSILPMLAVSWISVQQASERMKLDARDLLAEAAISKSDFIHSWFEFRFKDLDFQAQDLSNTRFLAQLKDDFKSSQKTLPNYVKSYDWEEQKSVFDGNLQTLLRDYDYIYDLFLIDLDGNILYTVAQESDLGDNLFEGGLATTAFARSVYETIQSGESRFSGIERYAPSNNALSGFLTAPMLDNEGNKVGVFAIQIKLAQLYQQISSTIGNVESRLHYLVNQSGYLISPIKKYEDVLNKKITTQPILQWAEVGFTEFKHEVEHEVGHEVGHESFGLNSSIHHNLYTGTKNQTVIGFAQSIRVANVNWLLISEIDESETLEAINTLEAMTFMLAGIFSLFALIAGLYQSRKIVKPIATLSKATAALSQGIFHQHVNITSHDEIGELADTFNRMLVTRHEYIETVQKQKNAIEAALYEVSEQKFALDQHSIVATTDLDGTITYVNNLFCAISGYSEEELIGNNHRILNSAYHDTAFFTDMYDTISSGEVFHAEICNQNKSGGLYWVDTTIVPNKDASGKVLHYTAIRTDITAKKASEKELIDALTEAKAATEAKSSFLANMSHEIRTPLNGVIGMTNLLLDSQLNKKQFERTKIVANSANSLLTIINDILDFSKIEAGKLDLEIIDFDLNALLTNLGATMAYRAEEKDIELICPANPIKSHWYKGDPGRIRQVLTNLIGNAIKFTTHGEVSVNATIINNKNGSHYLLAEVKDTGIGLTPKQQSTLFERFTQADESTTRKFGGTGLGLTISKQLVELMGGELNVESIINEGSTFLFTIELGASDYQSAPVSMPTSDDDKILVVDDNYTNRKLLEGLFDFWQLDSQQVESGYEALTLLKSASEEGDAFSTVIIDMQMPEMDGVELAKQIRADKSISRPHLVLLTSQARRGDAKIMQDVGFNGFLTKPVNQSDLYNALLQVKGLADNDERMITRHTVREMTLYHAQVLVVEDNITNQMVARGMLEKFGLRVSVAANGEEAIATLTQRTYDLVFMDYQMPIMDGIEATTIIRDPNSSVKQHDIPIIAMTANAMKEDKALCADVGMNDFIAKPVNPTVLHTALDKWLPESCHKDAPIDPLEQPNEDEDQAFITSKAIELSPIDEAVFDESVLQGLLDNPDQIRVITQAFVDDMPNQLAELKAALDNDDVKKAAAVAHRIKGSAASIGGDVVARITREMEMAAKAGKIQPVADAFDELATSFDTLKKATQNVL